MEMQIIPYAPELQIHFEKLNKRWLEEYFVVEPIDRQVLENPQQYIIANETTDTRSASNGLISFKGAEHD